MINKTEFIRVEKTNNFSIIHNGFLRRNDISWKAKGILAYILHLPNDWNINLNEVMQHSTEGKGAFNSGWKELKEAGYVERRPIKDQDTQKITHWETIVRENVDIELSDPQPKNPVSGKPTDWKTHNLETQSMENQSMENQQLLSTNNTKDLKELSTKNTNTRHRYGDNKNVLLTDNELEKLKNQFPKDLDTRINDLSYYMASKGKTYKNHYLTILSWARKDSQKQTKQSDLDTTDMSWLDADKLFGG